MQAAASEAAVTAPASAGGEPVAHSSSLPNPPPATSKHPKPIKGQHYKQKTQPEEDKPVEFHEVMRLQDAQAYYPTSKGTYLKTGLQKGHISDHIKQSNKEVYQCHYPGVPGCPFGVENRGTCATHIYRFHLRICITCKWCNHHWWSGHAWNDHFKKHHPQMAKENCYDIPVGFSSGWSWKRCLSESLCCLSFLFFNCKLVSCHNDLAML